MELYFHPAPAASRSVLLTLRAVGLDPKMKEINLFAKEQLRPEFVKLNPQHTIPTFVDNGFAIWESRAIMIYLAEKYGKNDTLYPKDPKTRAIVNQRLFFDMGTLYEKFSIFFRAKLARESQEYVEEKKKGMVAGVELLNTFLESNKYAAGNSLTLADLALVSSISTYELFDVDFNQFPNVMRWYKLCQETIPGYEVNLEGIAAFKQWLTSMK